MSSTASAWHDRTRARARRLTALHQDGQGRTLNRLIGFLQEKYGWNRERAAKELWRRMAKKQTTRRKRVTNYGLALSRGETEC